MNTGIRSNIINSTIILMVVVLLMNRLVSFCKKKTTYEMPISDWRSDVCSSDLHRRRLHAAFAGFRAGGAESLAGGARAAGAGAAGAKRQSVVNGKSVSVRVNLGGRRVIKKTKKQKYKNTTQ